MGNIRSRTYATCATATSCASTPGDRCIRMKLQSKYKVNPENTTPLGHEDYDWITLLTCESYSEGEDVYLYRRAVRAILVSVTAE